MPPIPGVWHWHSLLTRHAKDLKAVFTKATKALDAQLSSTQPQARLQPVLARNAAPKQPLHPLARIRQSQSRWYSTARKTVDATVRTFTSSARSSGPRYDRASFPASRVASYIAQSTGRAPFASTLRPNLTGGTLGRTAGGYTLGSGRVGGARYFSHGPAAQAQVVQNVSQAVRAFFVGGQKARYDGTGPNGCKRFKAVSALQEETDRKMCTLPRATPGSRVEFAVNPTITALTPLSGLTGYTASSTEELDHLNSAGLLDVLSVDFSRALKDLAAVLNDLKRLSALGDLPITYEGASIRIHFPGCDADTVERLCSELNISRGVVIQDEAFDAFAGTEIALLFPFAPSAEASEEDAESLYEYTSPAAKHLSPKPNSWEEVFTTSTPAYSTQSDSGLEDVLADEDNPWVDEATSEAYGTERSMSAGNVNQVSYHDPLEYQGFEGIYRFIEELDAVKRR